MTASLAATAAAWPAALANHWHGPVTWWPVFPALWLLVIAAVIGSLVYFGRRDRRMAGLHAGESRLAERFAAGEIGDQEYRDRLAVIRGQRR